jgi:hypothetical protein
MDDSEDPLADDEPASEEAGGSTPAGSGEPNR